ncbi:MAG: ferredoxin family protein [Deltaproteobacteria bacterium]|nr:ferredoxin family protein [Deltaproteobacteria bacterium]
MSFDQGFVSIVEDTCKGCALCVAACPVKVIHLSEKLNAHGYHPAHYEGRGCTACGICFYICPEPGVITIYRLPRKAESAFQERREH